MTPPGQRYSLPRWERRVYVASLGAQVPSFIWGSHWWMPTIGVLLVAAIAVLRSRSHHRHIDVMRGLERRRADLERQRGVLTRRPQG